MPRYPHAARRDAFCTKATQRDHALLYPFPLTVAYQMVGIITAGFPQHAHGCVLTQRVYFSLTQRRRFGRNIKDSGDSGSTFSASTFFALSWMMLVAGTEGTRSLSRVTDGTTGFGNLSALRAALSGKASANHYEPATSTVPALSQRDCHQNRDPDARQTTPSGHSYPLPLIPAVP